MNPATLIESNLEILRNSEREIVEVRDVLCRYGGMELVEARQKLSEIRFDLLTLHKGLLYLQNNLTKTGSE
jgi:hypothetical protein